MPDDNQNTPLPAEADIAAPADNQTNGLTPEGKAALTGPNTMWGHLHIAAPHVVQGSWLEHAIQTLEPSFKGAITKEQSDADMQKFATQPQEPDALSYPPVDVASGIDKKQHPIAKALVESAQGFTTPTGLATIAATGGESMMEKLAAAGFSVNAIHEAYKHLSSFKDAYDNGDASEAMYQLTHGLVNGSVAYLTGENAAEGAADVIREKGAQARENMAARKEASLNEARTGKVITVQPEGKGMPAAPDHITFDEAGGQEVSPPVNTAAPVEGHMPEPQYQEALTRRGEMPNQRFNFTPAYGETGGPVGGFQTSERDTNQLLTPYKVEVMRADAEGKMTPEDLTIPAYNVGQAWKTAAKQPNTTVFAAKPLERTPSTEYAVPNERPLSMPVSSSGKSVLATFRHELGHAMIGLKDGMDIDGMLRHTHPDIGYGARAAVNWNRGDNFDWQGRVVPERAPEFVRTFMGGVAADEAYNGILRDFNPNFDHKTAGTDAHTAYWGLRGLGLSDDEAMSMMHRAVDSNVNYLMNDHVADVVRENAGVREPNLSTQYHFSGERLKNMNAEIQRRMNNGPTEISTEENADNGANGERIPQLSAADDTGREGASAGSTAQGPGLQAREIEPSASKAAIEKLEKADLDSLKPKAYSESEPFNAYTAPSMVLPDGRIISAKINHRDIADAAGYTGQNNLTDFLRDTGAARIIYPLRGQGSIGVELHQVPSEDQLRIIASNLKNASEAGKGNNSLVWDLMDPNAKNGVQSGHGSIGAFRRAVQEKIPTGGTGVMMAETNKPAKPPKGSTVPLMAKPLNIEGTGPGGSTTLLDLAQALNKFSQNGLKPDKEIQAAVDRARSEIEYQLSQENTGLNWYKQDVRDALGVLHKDLFPDLKPGSTEDRTFRTLMGITSYGVKPSINIASASDAWGQREPNGQFPLVQSNGKNYPGYSGIKHSIKIFNNLIAEKGPEGAVDWLYTKHPTSEIREQKAKTHSTAQVGGKAADQQYGSMIFGPKGGAFALNLQGIHDDTTVDIWGARLIRRWTGNLTPENIMEPVTREESRQFKDVTNQMTEHFGLDKGDAQAVLWYYEHDLYVKHGVGEPAQSYKGAAEDYVNQRKAGTDKDFLNQQADLFAERYASPSGTPEAGGQTAAAVGSPENSASSNKVIESPKASKGKGKKTTSALDLMNALGGLK